jgi:hypothetical protein
MSLRLSQKEVQSVIALPSERRYRYFIKKAADSNRVWGLWNDGWAMGVTDDKEPTIPVWPASEYAELSRIGDWQNYVPRPIDLQEFMHLFLPQLQKDGIRISIFDTPSEESVFVDDRDLIRDLEDELSKIE